MRRKRCLRGGEDGGRSGRAVTGRGCSRSAGGNRGGTGDGGQAGGGTGAAGSDAGTGGHRKRPCGDTARRRAQGCRARFGARDGAGPRASAASRAAESGPADADRCSSSVPERLAGHLA
ncbi:MAG: hypothetical protein E6J82_17530 [Deltaproteobacteria bacterium]|nr:MAG: hypothetical protein E6J82_17530 [Deltaproteobacteria bacterium]